MSELFTDFLGRPQGLLVSGDYWCQNYLLFFFNDPTMG
jgi:hypothetical protein